ncbi:FapA family protein [Anaerocolumna sp. AGMB13025]|uniref:DUF342 domain-containing protein n=1 Tax=Anaerocolumna sp. AGMB13025 TaxID=3039116 RepID=UPI00241DDD32|nr:FapA family protein [Anaerocolumna sp. AGMB13025]WFR55697.1 FapA family protein [Anaerocolumna sp. AGMB13025]
MSEYEVMFSNEFFAISKISKEVFLQSFSYGIALTYFEKVLEEYPQINITDSTAVKEVLGKPSKRFVKIGEIIERIQIEISGDRLSAYLTLCVKEEELKTTALVKEIIMKLNKLGILYGVQKQTLLEGLCNGRRLLIAKGMVPVNGKDSIITMYQLKEYTPEIKEDGTVDYYELNLINKVEEGEWLGSRTDATKGTPGKTVKGETVPAVPGKTYSLSYDRKTVKEVYENGVTSLYSLRKGAVHYSGDKILVSNLLEISGDVDFKTGNIDFDGFVSVKGIVGDNFSISADKDIEILGNLGVGSVKDIVSRSGGIFIKGGIAGKGRSVVKSTADLYTKYISDATIICEGDVHISSYCFNSNIIAKQVFIESPNGQIVGGMIQADLRVSSSYIGNPGEKRTVIVVKGFDRVVLKEEIERLQENMNTLKIDMAKVKQEAFIYSHSNDSGNDNTEKYEAAMNSYLEMKESYNLMYNELKTIAGYLKIKGDGEISIQKKAYPNTRIELRNQIHEVRRDTLKTSFYLQNGEIKEV